MKRKGKGSKSLFKCAYVCMHSGTLEAAQENSTAVVTSGSERLEQPENTDVSMEGGDFLSYLFIHSDI